MHSSHTIRRPNDNMLNLLRHLVSRHGIFIAVASLILGAFEYFICAVVVNFDLGAVIGEAIKSLPPLMQSMMAEQFFGGFTTRGILAFGWNHQIGRAHV